MTYNKKVQPGTRKYKALGKEIKKGKCVARQKRMGIFIK
jgi:hypothetical protein